MRLIFTLFVALIFLVGFIGFVAAIIPNSELIRTVEGTTWDFVYGCGPDSECIPYEGFRTYFTLNKGWNLIPNSGEGVAFPSDCPVKYRFLYFPEEGYVGGEVSNQGDFIDESINEKIQNIAQEIGEDFTYNYYFTSGWVYSEEECEYMLNSANFYKDLDEFQREGNLNRVGLERGWNIFTISPYFINMRLNEVMDNCDIEKINFWNPELQSWEYGSSESKRKVDEILIENVDKDNSYLPILIKVADECKFGSSQINPPGLPTDDGSSNVINENLIIKQNFGNLNYNSIDAVNVDLSDTNNLPDKIGFVSGASVMYGDIVRVDVAEYEKDYTFENLKYFTTSFDSVLWDVELLSPPDFPSIYKITHKTIPSQVVLWYSRGKLIQVKGDFLFGDGTSREAVLETYLEKYATTVFPPGTTECTDTDGGLDYSVKGTVNCEGFDYIDHCEESPNNLVEYTTDGFSVTTPVYTCPQGCKDGACIGDVYANNCVETDGGYDSNIKGSIVCGSTSHSDICVSSSILVEYFIDDSEIKIGTQPCSNGCVDGACI